MNSHQAAPPTEIQQRLRAVARQLRQRRRVRLCVRAVWLALGVWSAGSLAALLGLTVSTPLLLIATATTLLLGLCYAWISHPSLARLARGLDRHYELDEQLATALEIGRRAPGTTVETDLIRDTDALLVKMRRYFAAQSIVPWREIETLAAVALLAAGLTIATQPLLPDAGSPVAIPDLPTPVAPTDVAVIPSDQPVEAPPTPTPTLPPDDQQAADAIADALRDNGATSSAAEALDRGDTAGAANELRELADQAEQLSDTARSDIAEGLRDAAEQLNEAQPDLAGDLREQANSLERGGSETEQALEDLARTVEELGQNGDQAAESDQGEQGQPSDQGQQGDQQGGQAGDQAGAGQGAGNGLGGESRGAQPDDAAQAEGDDVPLPSSPTDDGPLTEATGPRGPTVELGGGGTGQTDNSGSGGGGDQPLGGEADPLAIPSEYRDVVEEYFTPQ